MQSNMTVDLYVRVCDRVHVRRTDKVGTEAAFHPIEEYMVHVEEHFQYMSQRIHVDKKRVYLATDDPSLLQEAQTKWVMTSSGSLMKVTAVYDVVIILTCYKCFLSQ